MSLVKVSALLEKAQQVYVVTENRQIESVQAVLVSDIVSVETIKEPNAAKTTRGKIGRPTVKVDDIPDLFKMAYAAYAESGLSNISALARTCGLSRPTVYKYIALMKSRDSPDSETERQD